MRNALFVTIGLLAALFAVLAGCDEQITGGECQYRSFEGTATIRSVSPDDSPDRPCDDSVIIVFDFVLDDPGEAGRYQFDGIPDTSRVFILPGGQNPPDGWADREGLTAGSDHRCLRREIRIGTCTPVLFEFPDVDDSDWQDYCN